MKRAKQTGLCLAVVAALLFLCYWITGYRLTQERLFYDCERGLRYGPSEEIVFTWQGEGKGLVAGRCGEGFSMVEMRRVWGIFWYLDGAVTGYRDLDEPVNTFTYHSLFLAQVTDENITQVRVVLEDGREQTAAVPPDGFFTLDFSNGEETNYLLFETIEGLNDAGEILWQW